MKSAVADYTELAGFLGLSHHRGLGHLVILAPLPTVAHYILE